MTLQSRFIAVAKKMKADFEESSHTQHHGSRGTEREEILADFLKLYMPGTVDVLHNAEIVTLTGEVSRQCDIVIIDRNVPRLRDIQSHRIVPAECVFGVIEVKSHLNGKELLDSCTKIARIKELSRNAYVIPRRAHLDASGPQYPPAPIFGYVFAFGSIRLENLGNKLIDWCATNPREKHLDGVWVIDDGMLVWSPVGQSQSWHPNIAYPHFKRDLLILGSRQEGDILLAMVIGISSALTRPLPQLDFVSYLSSGLTYSIKSSATLPASSD